MDNGGLRYGAVEGALRPPLPTATQSALQHPTILLGLRRPKIGARLTDPSRRNIIASIRGSEPWVAGFKSESRPASDRNRWPASYWNAWPASSESAGGYVSPHFSNYLRSSLFTVTLCFFDFQRTPTGARLHPAWGWMFGRYLMVIGWNGLRWAERLSGGRVPRRPSRGVGVAVGKSRGH